MLRVTVEIDAPDWQAQAAKEALAMDAEKYGDTRIVDVRAFSPPPRPVWEQLFQPLPGGSFDRPDESERRRRR